MKKRSFLVILIVIAAYFAWDRLGPDNRPVGVSDTSDQIFADAFRNGTIDRQVQGHGKLIGILPDDNDGGRHQRFILKLGSGQTLLVFPVSDSETFSSLKSMDTSVNL